MSQYEEIVQIIEKIAYDTENKSYELLHYAEKLSEFTTAFSRLVNGTSDSSAKAAHRYFIEAQKKLYIAAKASLLAAKAGYDWCGGNSPDLQIKKLR